MAVAENAVSTSPSAATSKADRTTLTAIRASTPSVSKGREPATPQPRTPLSQAMLTETYQVYDTAEPLVAPSWFDCFDAQKIGSALQSGEAIAFLSVQDIVPGIDRVVAVFPNGDAFAWHQLNDKLKDNPNARLAD